MTHISKPICFTVAALSAAVMMPLAASAGSAAGTWSTAGGKSLVRISNCGKGLCGRIVKLRKPLDANGKPKLDKKNRNKALRKRRIKGMRILLSMLPTSKKDQWKGRIYNPEDGKIYTAYMTLRGRSLKVEGCVAAIFCKSQTWSRR